jgi:hypothetical protein
MHPGGLRFDYMPPDCFIVFGIVTDKVTFGQKSGPGWCDIIREPV